MVYLPVFTYIILHLVQLMFMVNVGINIPYMDHMGWECFCLSRKTLRKNTDLKSTKSTQMDQEKPVGTETVGAIEWTWVCFG